MGLRDWTATQISDGGTLGWITGMGVKLSIELLCSAVAGFLLSELAFQFTPVGALETAFGAGTKPGLWLVLTASTAHLYFHCIYTEPLQD